MSDFHCHHLSSRLTDEIREIFTALGSTMVSFLKPRDSWVFAGTYGIKEARPFEKVGTSCSFLFIFNCFHKLSNELFSVLISVMTTLGIVSGKHFINVNGIYIGFLALAD